MFARLAISLTKKLAPISRERPDGGILKKRTANIIVETEMLLKQEGGVLEKNSSSVLQSLEEEKRSCQEGEQVQQ